MAVERPSKNLMVTLPTDASQTTTSAGWCGRSLPSTLPRKRRSGRLDQRGRLLDALLALAALLADREQRHAGILDAEHLLGVDRAHPRVLGQVEAGRVGRGADVQQHERAAVGDHLDGQGRPVDARERPRWTMAEATPAPVCPAVTTASALPSRTRRMQTLMLASRLRRTAAAGWSSIVIDSSACTMVTWAGSGPSMKGADARLVTDQDDVGLGVLPRPVDGAAHDLLGRVVAAHGVDGDAGAPNQKGGLGG